MSSCTLVPFAKGMMASRVACRRVLLGLVCCQRAALAFPQPASSREFLLERERIMRAEDSAFLGAELSLNKQETRANDYLMALKHGELDEAFKDSLHSPSHDFLKAGQAIEKSRVFTYLRGMPKGAVLHVHDLSMASLDWVVANVTYRPDLYICQDGPTKLPRLAWLESGSDGDGDCLSGWSDGDGDCLSGWSAVADRRAAVGAERFDAYLKDSMTMRTESATGDRNDVWGKFEDRFEVLSGILHYEPVVKDHFRQGLTELLQDNVQLVEIRTALSKHICKGLRPHCDPVAQMELAAAFKEVTDAFYQDFGSAFCGVRMIFSPSRAVTPDTVEDYVATAIRLQAKFPDFFVGLDLAKQEDLGRPLADFANILLAASTSHPDLKFFFHAGETLWHGQTTDQNIIDALLLGTRRIGHGYAISKHPVAKRMAREAGVPIEMLGLVNDLRNHPAATLIQEGPAPAPVGRLHAEDACGTKPNGYLKIMQI